MKLAEFDGCAGFFELLLSSFSVVFGNLLFDGAWSVVNESFCLTKAKAGDFFDCLDDSNFLSTCVLEGNSELSFFVFSSASFGWGSYGNSSCSSCTRRWAATSRRRLSWGAGRRWKTSTTAPAEIAGATASRVTLWRC